MRKTRADKKIHVAPTVPVETKELLYSLAYLLDCPVKTLTENILIESSEDPQIMERISPYFKRDIKINNELFMGNVESRKVEKVEGETARISIRLPQTFNEQLKGLSYSMGCSSSRAALLVIETGLDDSEFILYVCSKFHGFVDNEKEIRRLIEGHRTVLDRVVDFVIKKWDDK